MYLTVGGLKGVEKKPPNTPTTLFYVLRHLILNSYVNTNCEYLPYLHYVLSSMRAMEVIFLGKKPFKYRFTSRSSPELWRWLVISKTD
jgi:hypothetical protein